jgi:hypothetical protein
MPQEPKRPVSELRTAALRTIVGNIQKLLWLDNEEGDGPEFWNAEKEWECADLLSFVAAELENHGLKPIDPPTVIGTTHKLDYDDEPIPEDYSDDPDPDHWTPHYRPPTS